MQDKSHTIVDPAIHPLKSLTAAQFAALGGTAVVYVRPIKGDALARVLGPANDFETEEDYHLVMSADGTPLYVTDARETVNEWLADQKFGIVALH